MSFSILRILMGKEKKWGKKQRATNKLLDYLFRTYKICSLIEFKNYKISQFSWKKFVSFVISEITNIAQLICHLFVKKN